MADRVFIADGRPNPRFARLVDPPLKSESCHRLSNAQGTEDFCGCCGNVTEGDPLWCDRCTLHIADTGSLWDRTYFGRYGLPCPFQIGGGI